MTDHDDKAGYVLATGNHPAFNTPSDDVIIWRYMSLSKLVHLIDTRTIHLTRLDRFNDKYEGALPRKTIESTNRFLNGYMSAEQLLELRRRSLFVNCWHVCDHESAAMWESYGSDDITVAIQSSVKRLRDSLPHGQIEGKTKVLYIGTVRYIDYDNDAFPENNIYWPSVHKRKVFESEKELRIVTLVLDTSERGINVPINVLDLAECFYVSPQAKDWQFQVLRSLLDRYGLSGVELRKSCLGEDPIG